MKLRHLIIGSAILVWAFGTAWADDAKAPQPAAAPPKIALVDLAEVFRRYEKFNALREELQAEIGQEQMKGQRLAAQITGKQARLQGGELQEGSPEHQALQQEVAALQAEFENFGRATQQKFLRKESQIYKTIYLEASDVIAQHARKSGYTLVMRFHRDDPAQIDDPAALLQSINRPVIFYRPEDDITDAIAEALNDRYKGKERPE